MLLIMHITFIADGNRRYSKKYNVSLIESYRVGLNKIKEVAEYLFKKDEIEELSFFVMSKENRAREKAELDALEQVFDMFFEEYYKPQEDSPYSLHFVGDLDDLSSNMRQKLKKIIANTTEKKKKIFFLINYSGRWEIEKLIEDAKYVSVNPKEIGNIICTNEMSDPQLLIRTGGRNRISNYMLFKIAYTELYFSSSLWGEFSLTELDELMIKFQKERNCTYGK